MVFKILASSVKPCSAISLTLRWFPVARKKPIIYLLTLQKVCKQSPVARQKAYYGSDAITRKPQRASQPNSLAMWACGRESLSLHAEIVWCADRCVTLQMRRCHSWPSETSGRFHRIWKWFSRNSSVKLPQPVFSGRWKDMSPLPGTFYIWFPNLSDH